MPEFVHLHQHTHHSMLDGASKASDAVTEIVRQGGKGLAITDHGNMFGAVDFYQECKKQGINPILGIEAYAAKAGVDERPSTSKKVGEGDEGGNTARGKAYYHQLLLARNYEGFQNLMKLSSRAYTEGFYYKPRLDLAMLEDHSKGLIATTSCLGGVPLQLIMAGKDREAMNYVAGLKDIMEPGHLFVELQDHGILEQKETNPTLIQIARKLDLPLVATNDSHYVHAHDHETHDALLCIQTRAKISDTDRFKFQGQDFYLKTADEMARVFDGLPEALSNTMLINDMVDIELPTQISGLPHFPLPEGFIDERDYLTHLVKLGANKRYAGTDVDFDAVVDRIEYELGVICEMGFASYFLINWDLIREAHARDILVSWGRGSASGSIVGYCLNITKVDPIRHDLIFERFLNPSRVSMPDIDSDFQADRRDEMIQYLKDTYGIDHVAQAITFGVIRSKAALKDSTRVQGYDYTDGEKLSKAFPDPLFGRQAPIGAVLREVPGLEWAYESGQDFRALAGSTPAMSAIVKLAQGIEGTIRSESVHPSAVMVSDRPLTEVCPTMQKPNGPLVTQWEQDTLEALGLLKLDILALKNLDILKRCMDSLELAGIEIPDIYESNPQFKDEATYRLLAAGKSIGVFQLESPAMRALLRKMVPGSIEDISATIALYRPGPMSQDYHNIFADRKNGRVPIVSIHERLEPLLKDTYQLPIYQEQVMAISREAAQFDMVEADNMRKAMGKKDQGLLDSFREKFVQGCIDNDYTEEFSNRLFDGLEDYASYAFNASHSMGYAYLSYWTAYFKANHTGFYMAALMDYAADLDGLKPLLAETQSLGVKIMPPTVQSKMNSFTFDPEVNGIHFPLSSIKGVGKIGDIISEGAPYDDVWDFAARVAINASAFQAVARSGGFDSLTDETRETLIFNQDTILTHGRSKIKDNKVGAMSLFGDEEFYPELEQNPEPEDEAVTLNHEKDYIGVFLSGHPVDGFEGISEMFISEINEHEFDGSYIVAAYLDKATAFRTKKGKMMAKLTLEDRSGSLEAVLFPNSYKIFEADLKDKQVYDFTLKVSHRQGEVTISVDSMTQLD